MKDIQYKTNISIKDYFPKMKKISYEKYNCEISYNKEKQIIPIKNKENQLIEFTTKEPKSNLTYIITLINTENNMIIGKSNLIIASLRLKQLKQSKRIKYEQQIKLALVKKMKESLFGPGINIGSIYLKLIIDISICFSINNNILLYKLENKNKSINFIGNNGSEYNLSNLSLSSFLTNLSTLKENKKQNGKNIKNVSSLSNINSNIKYLSTEIPSKLNKNNNNNDNIKENSSKRKIKRLSPNKIISLKKYRTKWHINKEYLKSNSNRKYINPKNVQKNLSAEKIKKNKIRKAFSNENIMNKNNKKKSNIEIINKNKRNISQSKQIRDINKTERKRPSNIKKITKAIKIYDNKELKKNMISIINDIKEKNKELKDKCELNNSKYLLMKEKINTQKKINNLINEEFEQKNVKNFIHVNINKKANNILIRKMPKIKLNELNIFKIIFNQKINNKNKKDPKLIIKEKLEEQKQIQLLINLIRNLIKIFGNLSHLYENDNNKKILIKSLFLRYNIKEREWKEGEDLFDIYENMLKEKEMKYNDRYKQEKNEFNTIKEEEDEDLNTIE